jgi:hypothetical protein
MSVVGRHSFGPGRRAATARDVGGKRDASSATVDRKLVRFRHIHLS